MEKIKASLVRKEYLVPFILITSLFFMWGFARAILDVLNKHFQQAMDLSIGQSAWVQFSVYMAYFMLAIPAGLYINKYGYRKGVVFGLLLFGVGALLFIPSEWTMSFYAFLGSLFVLGSGLVFLETAANPYVTCLGAKSTAASRLNLAQSFNGLGCLLAPMIGAAFMFSDDGNGSVVIPYGCMGVFVLIVAIVFTQVRLPEIKADDDDEVISVNNQSVYNIWKKHTFVFGLVALLCYEISEISINSLFINYVTYDGWLTPTQAATLLSLGALLLFLAGRVIGSLIMSRVKAEAVLAVCGFMTVACALLVVFNYGMLSKSALLACFLFESIMFPTIFAISLAGLGGQTKRAASFLMMTPIGGAIGTLLMGYLADKTTMSMSFLVPMLGYVVVFAYAIFALNNSIRRTR